MFFRRINGVGQRNARGDSASAKPTKGLKGHSFHLIGSNRHFGEKKSALTSAEYPIKMVNLPDVNYFDVNNCHTYKYK